jgi:hypothetical protein
VGTRHTLVRQGLRKQTNGDLRSDRVAFEDGQERRVEVTPAEVEPVLRLLQVEVERVLRHPVELGQPPLGVPPEALDAVDVTVPAGELVPPVVDPEMPLVADVGQPVVPAPAVGVDRHLRPDLAADHGPERGFGAVGDDLGVDPAVALEDAEHDRLLRRPAAALAADPAGAEVRLVDLDLAALERPAALALVRRADAELEVDVVDGPDGDAGEAGGVGGREVEAGQPQDPAEECRGELRAFVVAVPYGGTEVKSTSGRSSAS